MGKVSVMTQSSALLPVIVPKHPPLNVFLLINAPKSILLQAPLSSKCP